MKGEELRIKQFGMAMVVQYWLHIYISIFLAYIDGFSFTFEFNATLEELVAFYKWEREKSEKSLNFIFFMLYIGKLNSAILAQIRTKTNCCFD